MVVVALQDQPAAVLSDKGKKKNILPRIVNYSAILNKRKSTGGATTRSRAVAGGGTGGGSGNNMWRFYSEDSPGLKVYDSFCGIYHFSSTWTLSANFYLSWFCKWPSASTSHEFGFYRIRIRLTHLGQIHERITWSIGNRIRTSMKIFTGKKTKQNPPLPLKNRFRHQSVSNFKSAIFLLIHPF